VSRASGADVAEGDQTLGELLSMRRRRSGLADSVGEGKLKDGQTYDANRTSGPRIGIPQGRFVGRLLQSSRVKHLTALPIYSLRSPPDPVFDSHTRLTIGFLRSFR
jgi:hypothetical protein